MAVEGIAFMFRTPGLWIWAAIPVLLSLCMVVSAWVITFSYNASVMDWIWVLEESSGILGGCKLGIWWLVRGIVVAAMLLVLTMFGYGLSTILATPFQDNISEKVEAMDTGIERPFLWDDFFHETRVSILHSVSFLLLYVGAMICLLPLHLLPGIGSVAFGIIGFVCSAFFFTRELMDGIMTRRRFTLYQKVQTLRMNFQVVLGFGGAVVVMSWIPFFNILLLPMAVVGGTRLFCKLESHGRTALGGASQ